MRKLNVHHKIAYYFKIIKNGCYKFRPSFNVFGKITKNKTAKKVN